jgi:transcriptional regulator with XRE-family HTH domain
LGYFQWFILSFERFNTGGYMYESERLAERIKSRAKNRGVTLKELWEACGMGRNSMANLNSGRSLAHDSLARIADYLDCSVDYLLGRTDDPEAHKK